MNEYSGNEIKKKITQEFLEVLRNLRIFQARSGMNSSKNATPGKYIERFKVDDVICFRNGAKIESYATIATGNALYSCGAFSSVVSGLPSNTIVGRYACVASGVSVMGFRHPIDSICLNSAVFNQNRENVAAYIEDVCASDEHFEFNNVPTPQQYWKSIKIGNDVWVGSNALLAGGISIGNGAVVAARSIVTKDVPPYAIVAGSPAKIVKYRFPQEICQRLSESSWWNYHLKDLHKMSIASPEKFCNEIERNRNQLEIFNPQKLDIHSQVNLLT